MRLRLPDVPPLHDIPNLIPPALGHRLAAWTGMSHAYSYFCHHCPEPDIWGDTPGASTTETDPGGTLLP